MLKRLKNGQSTLEYVIILAAVVGAIILASVFVKNSLNTGYTNLNTKLESKVNEVAF